MCVNDKTHIFDVIFCHSYISECVTLSIQSMHTVCSFTPFNPIYVMKNLSFYRWAKNVWLAPILCLCCMNLNTACSDSGVEYNPSAYINDEAKLSMLHGIKKTTKLDVLTGSDAWRYTTNFYNSSTHAAHFARIQQNEVTLNDESARFHLQTSGTFRIDSKVGAELKVAKWSLASYEYSLSAFCQTQLWKWEHEY